PGGTGRASALPPRRHPHAGGRGHELRGDGRGDGRVEAHHHAPAVPRAAKTAARASRLLRRANRRAARVGDGRRLAVTRPHPERLMPYLDGEVDDRQAILVEPWLSESEEARALLRELTSLGNDVRAVAEETGMRAGGIADAVMAQIDARSSGERPKLTPVRGG